MFTLLCEDFMYTHLIVADLNGGKTTKDIHRIFSSFCETRHVF